MYLMWSKMKMFLTNSTPGALKFKLEDNIRLTSIQLKKLFYKLKNYPLFCDV